MPFRQMNQGLNPPSNHCPYITGFRLVVSRIVPISHKLAVSFFITSCSQTPVNFNSTLRYCSHIVTFPNPKRRWDLPGRKSYMKPQCPYSHEWVQHMEWGTLKSAVLYMDWCSSSICLSEQSGLKPVLSAFLLDPSWPSTVPEEPF